MRTPTLFDPAIHGEDTTTNRNNENFIIQKILEGYFSIDESGNVFNNKTKKFVGSESTGYKRITCNNEFGKSITANVNRLVYLFFVDDIPANFVVNHLDGNKLNNYYRNLEATTTSQNQKHAYQIGLKYISEETRRKSSERTSGSKNMHSKLTEEQVISARIRIRLKQTCLILIMEEFDLSPRCARNMLLGKSYVELPEKVTPAEIKAAMLYFRTI